MKVVQFFKTYNFHVVQIFTRSNDFEIFSNPSKLSFTNKHNLSFKIARASLSIKLPFYEDKGEKPNIHFNPS